MDVQNASRKSDVDLVLRDSFLSDRDSGKTEEFGEFFKHLTAIVTHYNR
jgi:hypothetical protein